MEDLHSRQFELVGEQQIHATKALIFGSDGIAAEVAKNFCLAGVGTVVICDKEVTRRLDPHVNVSSPCNFAILIGIKELHFGTHSEYRTCKSFTQGTPQVLLSPHTIGDRKFLRISCNYIGEA